MCVGKDRSKNVAVCSCLEVKSKAIPLFKKCHFPMVSCYQKVFARNTCHAMAGGKEKEG